MQFLTTTELQEAENLWLKHAQKSDYGEILNAIRLGMKNDMVNKLGLLFYDKGGRGNRSNWFIKQLLFTKVSPC